MYIFIFIFIRMGEGEETVEDQATQLQPHSSENIKGLV